ncbi:MAG: UDP-N-acetylmuramoyl-L-alanyl-D-glutamate--2,6-diaminopimelate ligase [Pirellulales bacterium]|nr:UDP-N-acetylmuramoyl-L-alanyl-D-glutamate--2,6-diaminopimelate ligase [Pirellulales bacterium]
MDRGAQPLRGISLRQVLPEAVFFGADDVRVQSCTADSRSCRPGDLFVALRGTQCDGHDYALEAIGRGAQAVLAERPIPGIARPMCLVPDSRVAFGRLCQTLAGEPSRQLKVIGITGTNGKTTTSLLVASILNTAGYPSGLIGTLGCCDGVEIGPAELTTPSPPAMAEWLARMAANGCTHGVVEVSSHALAQHRVSGIQFDAVAVTNVCHDHLDFHGSLEEYRAAKGRLFDHLSVDGVAVVNADDAVCAGYLCEYAGPALTFGLHRPAEICGMTIERLVSEQTFLLTIGNETVPVRSKLIGAHNVYNCLAAAGLATVYGIDLATIARGIEEVDKVPGRLERIECGQPFAVFVDYAHTPDALGNSLDALQPLVEGRLICVFGAGGDRDRGKRPLMGRTVEQGAHVAIVTSDNPRHEDPQKIAREVLAGFRVPQRARVILDRGEAIAAALSEARPGDCVLIAGKGHEDYQVVGDERLRFDDRAFVRQWLYEQGEQLGRHKAA